MAQGRANAPRGPLSESEDQTIYIYIYIDWMLWAGA